MSRKQVILLVVLCLLAGIGLIFYQRWTTLAVRAVEVVRRDVTETVVASGRVETPFRVEIGSQVTGTVAQVRVAEGQIVKSGETLVQLEDSEAVAAVELAKAGIYQAQARLNQIASTARPAAEQSLNQATANYVNAQRQFARAQQLYRDNITSRAQLDEAQRAVDVAESLVRAARLQVLANMPDGSEMVLAESNLLQAKASLLAAQAKLDYTIVTAPSDARIITRQVERGAVVQPAKVLLVLSPLGPTQLVVQIDEKNLGLIREGQKARVSADAFPTLSFAAELTSINPAVDAQRGSVEVKLRVIEPPDYLRENMTVSIDIEVSRKEQTLVAPAEALRDLGTPTPRVFRIRGGRAVATPVKTGAQGGHLVEILDGVAEHDQLVGTLPVPVADGARVRVTR